jgi:hypothetical protein
MGLMQWDRLAGIMDERSENKEPENGVRVPWSVDIGIGIYFNTTHFFNHTDISAGAITTRLALAKGMVK